MKKTVFQKALRDTLPIMTGYLVLGAGFGILMSTNGYPLCYSVFSSVFIYAGSMQYLSLDLLNSGAGMLSAILYTVAVNGRHIFYGLSMLPFYRHIKRFRSYLIFTLTDETFSLLSAPCSQKEEDWESYALCISLLDHLYWCSGTLIGALLGDFLVFDTRGIDFSLTALFVTILCSQWLDNKDHYPALCGLGLTWLCRLVFGSSGFLIPSMILILLALLMRKQNGEEA
jgi:4-azaleucine resistance transporter AzlC